MKKKNLKKDTFGFTEQFFFKLGVGDCFGSGLPETRNDAFMTRE